MYSSTLRLPDCLSRARIASTHLEIRSGGASSLVCSGPRGLSGLPLGSKPSPASERCSSYLRCGPNLPRGKPEDVASLATQPMVGTVSAILMPCACDSLSQNGKPASFDLTFSKNQSLPVFQTLPRSQFSRVI